LCNTSSESPLWCGISHAISASGSRSIIYLIAVPPSSLSRYGAIPGVVVEDADGQPRQ
jgi:hypothetical protein